MLVHLKSLILLVVAYLKGIILTEYRRNLISGKPSSQTGQSWCQIKEVSIHGKISILASFRVRLVIRGPCLTSMYYRPTRRLWDHNHQVMRHRKVGEGVGWVQFAVFLGNRRGTDELIHLWSLSFHWSVSGFFISPVPWKPSTDHSEPRVGKTPWRRKWQPLQYSCLGNPMDRGAWRATAHGATELDMTEQPALLHSFFLNSNFIKIKDKGHLQPKKKKNVFYSSFSQQWEKLKVVLSFL